MTPDSLLAEPLSPEEREQALDALARRIHQYRLETPAILFLEANRPLVNLVGLASFAVTPLFGAFVGLDRAERYATLLTDRTAMDDLLDRLDCMRAAAKAGNGSEPATDGAEDEDKTPNDGTPPV